MNEKSFKKQSRQSKANNKIKSYLSIAGKGFFVGGSMLVPGVSGGSMAMILGIYGKLIDAVSSFFKHIKWSIQFLLVFCFSAMLGMFLFAKPLLNLIEQFPLVMMFFFIGAVFGSVPMIVRKAEVKQFSIRVILYPILGYLMMYGINLLPENTLNPSDMSSLLRYIPVLIAGIVVAVALVLPGISVSYMLLVLGFYEDTMQAISNLDLLFLMPLGIGLVLGIIMTTKLLEKAMEKQPEPTYLIILGFIFASCVDVFPGVPKGTTLYLAVAMFFCGAYLVYRLSKLED